MVRTQPDTRTRIREAAAALFRRNGYAAGWCSPPTQATCARLPNTQPQSRGCRRAPPSWA
jgi:hypothetical protein